MIEGEVSFLLRILNHQFPVGHVKDDHPLMVLEGLIRYRLMGLGLIAEFHFDRKRWYVHQNDETGDWK